MSEVTKHDPGRVTGSEAELKPVSNYLATPTAISVEGREVVRYKTPELKVVDIPKLFPTMYETDREMAKKLLALLQNPTELPQHIQCLAMDQQDSSWVGIRTLKFVLPEDPDHIYVLSGVGVVRADREIGRGNRETFTLEPPHWQEPLDLHYKMGHMCVDRTGKVWKKGDQTTFGTHRYTDMAHKINDTKRYSADCNGNTNLELVVAGRFLQHPTHGWWIYRLPSNIVHINSLLEVDLRTRKTTEETGVHGQFIYDLCTKIKKLHDQDRVHMELHPGNCMGVLDETGVSSLITDWDTVQNTAKLPIGWMLSFQGYQPASKPLWGTDNPAQIAKSIDLFMSLENASLLTSKNFNFNEKNSPGKLNFDILTPTKDMIDIQITWLVHAICAYTKQPLAKNLVTEYRGVLWSVFDHIANIHVQSDFRLRKEYQKEPNIFLMEKSSWIVGSSFRELRARVTKALVQQLPMTESALNQDVVLIEKIIAAGQ